MSKENKYAEYEEYLTDKERALKQAELQISQAQSMAYAPAMYGAPNKQNLVEWELDFKGEIEDIERLLRCDVLVRDTKTNREEWIRNPDHESIVLNEQGVNDILREIILLVNKNKVLSNYDINEIKARVRLIGHELRAFIYNNYERYGIDNEYKMNNYPVMVLAILDVIEAAFRRALNGETHRGLNEARIVQQNEPLYSNAQYPQQPQLTQKRGISRLAPWNWGR